MNSEPTPATIYLDGHYLARNRTYHVEDSAWKAHQIQEMIRRNHIEPQTVCEVGCGAGEVLRQLQMALPASVQLDGYDVSPDAIQLCQQRANDRLRFHCADFLTEETPFYELLLCIDVVEHVEDYIGFVRQLRPRAAWKIFHFPLDMAAHMIIRRKPLLMVRQDVGHLHYFIKDTAPATLEYTGYTVVDWHYTPNRLERASSWKSKLLKWPRKVLSSLDPDLVARTLGGYSLLVLTK